MEDYRNIEAARNLFSVCDKDNDGYITRSDLEALVEELQLEESVDTLLTQLGADSSGRISLSTFIKCGQTFQFQSDHLPVVEESKTDIRKKEVVIYTTRRPPGMEYSDCVPSSSDNSLDRKNRGPWEPNSKGKSRFINPLKRSSKKKNNPEPPLQPPPPSSSSSSSSRRIIQSGQQQDHLLHLANTLHMSAVNSLQREVEDLKAKLAEVTEEKTRLLEANLKMKGGGGSKEEEDEEEGIINEHWEIQCQRYEERIVELHSVIAELSRKIEVDGNEIIVEESEFEEEEDEGNRSSLISDSCDVDEDDRGDDDENDYTSLAFERALDSKGGGGSGGGGGGGESSRNSSKFSSELHLVSRPDVDFSAELFALQAQLDEARNENERLLGLVDEKDTKLAEDSKEMELLAAERDRYKRQLEDLKATVEYQEAKMDNDNNKSASSAHGTPTRSSSERRSLRKKRHEKRHEAFNNGDKGKGSLENETQRSSSSSAASSSGSRLKELELETERLSSKVEHLKSQNEVLALTLDDSKSLTDRLTVLLGKHESNNSALQLALNYCDHIVEAYDVLVALLETEAGLYVAFSSSSSSSSNSPNPRQLLLHHHHHQHQHHEDNSNNTSLQVKRAISHRKSAEKVARHLLTRMLNRSDSGFSADTTATTQSTSWDDYSSGYSQTTSSTSTTSSCLNEQQSSTSEFSKADEMKLRDHISQLKTIRASIQSSVTELESLHIDPDLIVAATETTSQKKKNTEVQLEQAVQVQELMASREEKADLRAKVYLLEKEKANLASTLEEKGAMEGVLRTHIAHLQEELGELERDLGLRGGHLMSREDPREAKLKVRVINLLDTLDKISRNSETRQRQSNELIEDLKRANSTLTEALEKSKRKYQSKIKKLEQQILKKQ